MNDSTIKTHLINREHYRWTTKAGEKMFIKDMTTSHIKNCMNLIKDKVYIRSLSASDMAEDAKNGLAPSPGTHAEDDWYNHFDELLEKPGQCTYWTKKGSETRFYAVFKMEIKYREYIEDLHNQAEGYIESRVKPWK